MIKLTFVLVRRAEFTREKFQAYWRDRHAPLVRSVAEVLRIRRYVQTHSLPAERSAGLRASRQAPKDFDGVSEFWWDNWEDATKWRGVEAAAAGRRLMDDERAFIDLARSPLWWGEEIEVVGPAAAAADQNFAPSGIHDLAFYRKARGRRAGASRKGAAAVDEPPFQFDTE